MKLVGNANGDHVAFSVTPPATGTYRVYVGTKNNPDRGKFRLTIDGAPQGPVTDTYSATDTYPTYDLGTVTFTSTTTRQFRMTLTESTKFQLAVDFVVLVPVGTG